MTRTPLTPVAGIALVAFATGMGAPSASAQAGWSVDPTPTTEIASLATDGEVQLEMPVGVIRLSDGTIVVADGRLQTLSYFDASGSRARLAGRRGAGPGEFNSLSWAGQCGADSVTAWDRSNNRLTTFDAAGNVARESSLPLEPAVAGRTAFSTCSRSGDMGFVSLPMQMDPNSPVQRGEAMVTVVAAGGSARQVGTKVNSSEVVVMGGGGVPMPLGLTTTLAIANGHVYIGTGDSAAVLVYSLEGDAGSPLAAPAASRRPIRSGQYESAVEELLQMVPSGAAPMVRSALMDLPRASQHPAYSSILADRQGTLWIVQSAPNDPTRLFAVNPDGRTAAQLELPRQLRVWEIGDDYILAQYTNELGEPFIVSYRLRR